MEVFLDHSATTPLRARAKSALLSALELVGNPSSVHSHGQSARALVEDARDQVAATLGANRSEVIFTSGGTESNNQAIKGLFWASGKKLIISAYTEHHAVIDPIEWLVANQGAEVHWLKISRDGQIDFDDLESVLLTRGNEVALISLMWVNNETGVVSDIPRVCQLAAEYSIPVHSDAVAAFGHLPISFKESGLASLAVSGHKVGAPIGVGALLVARNQKPISLIHGGSQERSLRSGTISHPLIASFAAAATESIASMAEEVERIGRIRDSLEQMLRDACPEAIITVEGSARSCHISHLIFPGAQSDNLLFLLDQQGISASAGSACTAGVLAPSHVLIAMGIDPALADCAIRVSFGHTSTIADAEAFVAAIVKAYPIAVLDAANQKAI